MIPGFLLPPRERVRRAHRSTLNGGLGLQPLLVGTLASEIGLLNQLTNLDLRSNLLSGTLPTSIGGLNSVTYLQLFQNSFRRDFPFFPFGWIFRASALLIPPFFPSFLPF